MVGDHRGSDLEGNFGRGFYVYLGTRLGKANIFQMKFLHIFPDTDEIGGCLLGRVVMVAGWVWRLVVGIG